MNILYVNTCYLGGGAEKVTRQLYYGMKDKDTKTFFVAGRYQKDLPADVEIIYHHFFERAISAVFGIMNHNFLFRTILARKKIIDVIKRERIDIVHFHNLHGNYIGPSDLKAIRKHCRNIVITMHDMWLITGCCPYGMSCEEWRDEGGCRRCRGNEAMKKGTGRAKFYLGSKVKHLKGQGYYFVSPSKWLMDCCAHSYMKGENIQLIYNGVNTHIFRPRNKVKLREKYGISRDKRVLMFSAHKVENPYKGFGYLCEALKLLKHKENYCLLVIGTVRDRLMDLSFETHSWAYLADESMMSEIYSSADLFIVPSMADNFPLVILESMASGTPVLAFNTGGIVESVTAEAGWCTEAADSERLCSAIENIFEHEKELENKTAACTPYIVNHFSEDIMLDRYRSLYEEVMKKEDSPCRI